MKYIFLPALFFFSCLFSGVANSQTADTKHAINIRLGTISSNRMINALNDFSEKAFDPFISSLFTGGYIKTEITDRRNTPAVSLSYFYNINNRFAIGSTATFEKTSAKFKVNDEFVGRFQRNYLTTAAEATYVYDIGKRVEFYGLLGLGYTFSKPTTQLPPEWKDRFLSNRQHPNIQITPLALRTTAHEKLRFAFEVGFGYKGLLNAGLDYRF